MRQQEKENIMCMCKEIDTPFFENTSKLSTPGSIYNVIYISIQENCILFWENYIKYTANKDYTYSFITGQNNVASDAFLTLVYVL